DLDRDIEVAGLAAAPSALALAAELEARPAVHPGRDADVQRVLPPASPGAAAVGARIGNDRAVPVARTARLGDGEEALLEADLSGSPALRAHLGLRSGLRAAAVAGGAGGEARDGESLVAAARRPLEGDLELVLEILTPSGPCSTAAAAAGAEEVAEEVPEDVLEPGAEVEAAESPALLEGRVAEAVVPGSPLGIGQHLVGLPDLLEALLGLHVAGVLVGVVLVRQLAVGLLQVLVAAGAGDPQHLVVVALHRSSPARTSALTRVGADGRARRAIGPAATRDPGLFLHFLELSLDDVVLRLPLRPLARPPALRTPLP